jgi:hypothetical protein
MEGKPAGASDIIIVKAGEITRASLTLVKVTGAAAS